MLSKPLTDWLRLIHIIKGNLDSSQLIDCTCQPRLQKIFRANTEIRVWLNVGTVA